MEANQCRIKDLSTQFPEADYHCKLLIQVDLGKVCNTPYGVLVLSVFRDSVNVTLLELRDDVQLNNMKILFRDFSEMGNSMGGWWFVMMLQMLVHGGRVHIVVRR